MIKTAGRRSSLTATAGVVLAAALGGLSMTGCAKTIDADAIENDVAGRTQWNEISCEDGVEAKVGAKVPCKGQGADGTPVKANIVVTAIDGDDVSYEVRPVS